MSRRLGENLVDSGHLTEAQLHRALTAHLVSGGHLGTTLLELGYIGERTLGETLARMYGVAHTDFNNLSKVPYSVIRALPAKLAAKHKVIPLALEAKKLHLAMIDPKNLMAIDEISFVTGYHIEPSVSPEVHILHALEMYYNIRRSQRYITLERELARLRAEPHADQIGEDEPAGEAMTQEAAVGAEEGVITPDQARSPSDPWAKYGYGRSWREFADALDGGEEEGQHVDTRPQAVTTLPERPEGREEGAGRSLMEVSRRVADSQSVEDIVSTVLGFAAEHLQRCMMFVVKGESAVGWAGRGAGLTERSVERLSLPLPSNERDSIFSVVQEDTSHYLGPVPTLHGFERFYRDLGVPQPRFLMLIPIVVKGRITAYLYGDCGDSVSLTMDVQSLLSLCKRAGMALQIIILRNKILSVT